MKKQSKRVKTKSKRLGVWIVGIGGGVGTTVLVGTHFIKKGLVSTAGLITETEIFKPLNLVPLDNLVFGGYDIRTETVWENAIDIQRQTKTFSIEFLNQIKDDLDKIDNNIKFGTTINCGETIEKLATAKLEKNDMPLYEMVKIIQNDLISFKNKYKLDNVIFVNLASTEPFNEKFLNVPSANSLEELEKAIKEDKRDDLPASTIYAYSAIDCGFPYINFTPSIGSETKAMQELAIKRGVPHMGKDGKTGETMVKSNLAPMFIYRNLPILSWAGFNILGDRDGQVLSDPKNKATKIRSKDRILHNILGYSTYVHTAIEYVPSLSDWKTAWDHIHFKGFIDTKMVMQFIWQGCDAILAAPLILDLIRMADYSKSQGEKGLMKHLACIFKSPIGIEDHNFHNQYQMLMNYVKKHSFKD
jgi:myo-inositol-1-phosphate synthase